MGKRDYSPLALLAILIVVVIVGVKLTTKCYFSLFSVTAGNDAQQETSGAFESSTVDADTVDLESAKQTDADGVQTPVSTFEKARDLYNLSVLLVALIVVLGVGVRLVKKKRRRFAFRGKR